MVYFKTIDRTLVVEMYVVSQKNHLNVDNLCYPINVTKKCILSKNGIKNHYNLKQSLSDMIWFYL